MNRSNLALPMLAILAVLYAASGTGCATSPSAVGPATSEANATAADTDSTESPEVTGAGLPEATAEPALPPMDRPFDGSSLEAFEQGLRELESSVSSTEFRRLNSALNYLLLYDIGARSNWAVLYSRLDGQSANQIIAQADSMAERL